MNLCKQRKTSNQCIVWVKACRKVNGSVALHYTARMPARRRARSAARPTTASPSARTCGVKIRRERPPRPSSRSSVAWTDAPPHTGKEALNTDNVRTRRSATATARTAVAAAAGGTPPPAQRLPPIQRRYRRAERGERSRHAEKRDRRGGREAPAVRSGRARRRRRRRAHIRW